MVQLHRDIGHIRDAGADMVLIGNGGPSFIAGFREETGWDGAIYVDPSLAVYRAAELKRGVARTLDPRGLGSTVRALARGHRQALPQGDPWQQGGVLVVMPSGEVRWHHVSGRPDDHASAEQILAALKAAG